MKLADNLNNLENTLDILKIGALGTDFVTSLCGKWLGSGIHRSVYVYNLDPRYVIKVEPLNTGTNLNEWQIWQEVQGLCGELAFVKDWLAPVKWISPNGRLLVMRRTRPYEDYPKRELPKKVPKFLWDVKEDNFGWIGNNYVCHDYGQFYNFLHYSKAMVKSPWADWINHA